MRNIPKQIYQFMKKEVGITKAEWGEVRKVDRRKIVHEGLPNIPKLTITQDPFVYYIAVIRKIKELRIYAFSKEGMMLPAKSFFNDEIDEAWKSVTRQSRKLTRYPSSPKILTQGQKNRNLNRVFKKIWEKTLTTFNVPKENQKHYPTLTEIKLKKTGPWGTDWDNLSVFIPEKVSNLKTVCYYYSFLFILPENLRKYKDLSRIIAIKMMISFRQLKDSQDELILHIKDDTKPILEKLSDLNAKLMYNYLNNILSLFPFEWTYDDLVTLFRNFHDITQNKESSMILYELFKITGTLDFYGLTCLHSIIDDTREKIPPICLNDNIYYLISSAISSFKFSKMETIMNNNIIHSTIEKTIIKALEKSFQDIISITQEGWYNNSDQKLIISKKDDLELKNEITVNPLSFLDLSLEVHSITIHFPNLFINFPVTISLA